MATLAPYETTLTAGFTAIGEGFGFLEKISPAITDWIAAKVPIEKQRIMDRRIRRCKRICRKGGYNLGMISNRVNVDFQDLSLSLIAEITNLIEFELKK